MFDRCVVINLEDRPERLASFRARVPTDWPLAPIERVRAFDGNHHRPPAWYAPDHWERYRGAWGCFQSHLSIYKQAVADGIDSVLIFEDDAVFAPDFTADVRRFLDAVPADWDAIYLGGQHLNTGEMPPVRVDEVVCRGRNVNRTHAYAMRRAMLEHCIEMLDRPWPRQQPVNYYNFDYQLGAIHRTGDWNVYAPTIPPLMWLVGQAAGVSDVSRDPDSGRAVSFRSTLWWKEFPVVTQEPAAC